MSYRKDYKVRTKFKSLEGRHGRTTSEFPCFVIARSKNPPSIRSAAYSDGLIGQLWLFSDFYRRIKTIHIDMDNLCRLMIYLSGLHLCLNW